MVGLALGEDGFRTLDSFISFVQDADLDPDVSLLWMNEIAMPVFVRFAMAGKCLARRLAYLSLYLQAFVAVFLLMRKLSAIC